MAYTSYMEQRRLTNLAVLGLIACDDAYRNGLGQGDLLRTNPDSALREEYFFPTRLADEGGLAWREPPGGFIGEYEFPDWTVVAVREDESTGFAAVIYQNAAKTRAIVALRGTNGADPTDWYANLQLGKTQWQNNINLVVNQVLGLQDANGKRFDGEILFTGQSLGGALAEYMAHAYGLQARAAGRFAASKLSLITFNGLGGLDGLMQFGSYDPSLLAEVTTAHYAVRNDLVHRLGGGHVNGERSYVFEFADYIQPVPILDEFGQVIGETRSLRNWGPIEAHRIESGFYRGLERSGLSFRDARPYTDFSPVDSEAVRAIGATFANFLNDSDHRTAESTARAIAAVASALALAPTDKVRGIAQAVFESFRLSQEHGDLTHWRLAQNFFVDSLTASAGLPAFRYTLAAAATMLWCMAEGLDAAESFDAFNARLRELTPPDVLPDPGWMFAVVGDASISEVSHKLTVLATITGPDAALRFGAALVGLSLSSERLLTAFGSTNWKAALFRLVAEEARDKGARLGDVVGGLAEGILGLAGALTTYGQATTFLEQTIDAVGSAVRGVGAGVANAFKDLTNQVSGALIDWPAVTPFPALRQTATEFIERIRRIDPWGLVGIGAAQAREVPTDFETAADLIAQAGEKIALRSAAEPNPFNDLLFDPDANSTPPDGVSEGGGRHYSLFLPYIARPGGQRIALRLEGVDADKFTVLSANSTQPIAGGRFYLVVPEGAKQVAFTLWNDEDVDESATLTLHAQLVDATGSGTHLEHEEAEIAFTTVDEQPFTVPGAVVIDPEPANPEIYGTDADEQILGKDTKDIVYPLMGADLVRTGAGDDSVLVYFSSGGDTAGDWVELGEGNDFAVRWAGEDTLIGGPGADVMLAGADSDTLYADREIALSDAIAQGETQGAGGTGDLLDGWAGDDVAIGWSGADGMLGGDGEDVLVGMGGDDNAFGDWQFSQYTSASADWRVERETTWVTPDRRKVTARLVSVLTTETSVAGGADTIFGGAGADWLLGQAGDDFIDGGRDDDVIFGDEGADALYGRDGADILSGDDLDDSTAEGLSGALHGADTLDGGAGDDELSGNGGDDQLYGGDGYDTLGGDDPVTPGGFHGKDYLAGGAGNDRLWGQGNDDWLVGGDGDDHLEGDYTDLEARFHGADHPRRGRRGRRADRPGRRRRVVRRRRR